MILCLRFSPSVGSLVQKKYRQNHEFGQALLEGLLCLGFLLIVFWAVTWLGRYRDWTDILAHASRQAAFLTAQQALAVGQETDWLVQFWLADAPRRWSQPNGQSALGPAAPAVHVRRDVLPDDAQPGGSWSVARDIRQQWQLQDPGMPSIEARLQVPWLPRQGQVQTHLLLKRHAVVAMAAGASPNDTDASDRIEVGDVAWADAAKTSRELGREVVERWMRLDSPWSRPDPRWDWVASWQRLRPLQDSLEAP